MKLQIKTKEQMRKALDDAVSKEAMRLGIPKKQLLEENGIDRKVVYMSKSSCYPSVLTIAKVSELTGTPIEQLIY